MALNKLRDLDGTSTGVTLPRDDLRLDGLVDDAGEIEGEHMAHIHREGPRENRLTILARSAIRALRCESSAKWKCGCGTYLSKSCHQHVAKPHNGSRIVHPGESTSRNSNFKDLTRLNLETGLEPRSSTRSFFRDDGPYLILLRSNIQGANVAVLGDDIGRTDPTRLPGTGIHREVPHPLVNTRTVHLKKIISPSKTDLAYTVRWKQPGELLS